MAAVLYWRLPELALTTQVRCPGSPAFHQRCCITIPSGATTWQSDPNSSQTSPARFKTRPGKVTPRQLGHHREVTPAPPSSAKLQCGGPPTASIPKTHDQPEEANSKHFRPSRNNASTGTSPIPPIRHAARGPTSDRHEAPPVAAITTGSAHTENPNGVPAGRSRHADSTPQASGRDARNTRMHSTRPRQTGTPPNLALFICREWYRLSMAPRPAG
jgi:hypothetical protein